MEASDSTLILDAVSAMRQDVRDLRGALDKQHLETENRLTKLEADSKDISGNGQPGRMSKVETAVAAMAVRFGWIAGAAAVGGGVVGLLGWIFPRH